MTLLVLAGAAGAFGRGPFARARTSAPPIEVEYDRVVRYQTPTRIAINVPADSRGTRVFVNRALLDRVQLQSVVPQPVGAEPRTDGAILLFAPTGGPGRITLIAQPSSLGLTSDAVSVDGAGTAAFHQFVLP